MLWKPHRPNLILTSAAKVETKASETQLNPNLNSTNSTTSSQLSTKLTLPTHPSSQLNQLNPNLHSTQIPTKPNSTLNSRHRSAITSSLPRKEETSFSLRYQTSAPTYLSHYKWLWRCPNAGVRKTVRRLCCGTCAPFLRSACCEFHEDRFAMVSGGSARPLQAQCYPPGTPVNTKE